MKQIPIDSKIINFTHLDFDGILSSILLGQIYKKIKYVHCSFYKIDDLLATIDPSQYDYIYITDIHPEHKENLDRLPNAILIDHHKSASEYHNPSLGHYVIWDKNVCAAVLVKQFLEKMYNIKLDKFNSITHLCSDYDTWQLKNFKSSLFNDVMFFYYRPTKFRELFFDGHTRFSPEEIVWLKKRRIEFKNMYDNLNVYEFTKINGCIVESTDFINEIAHKLMEEENYKIVCVRNPRSQRISIRHNIEGLDMGLILKNLSWGGGHPTAAGAFSLNNEDFKMKMNKIEEIVSAYVEEHKNA